MMGVSCHQYIRSVSTQAPDPISLLYHKGSANNQIGTT